jgi:hypothetical protein
MLIEGGEIRVLELLGQWGYTYDPAIPNMSKNEF